MSALRRLAPSAASALLLWLLIALLFCGLVAVLPGTEVGSSGTRRLSDDQVTGEDPLRGFGQNAAEANEVAPFEEFMGSHGGWQSHPFALIPSGWSPPKPPIVGAAAIHQTIRGWLVETGLELRTTRAAEPPSVQGRL